MTSGANRSLEKCFISSHASSREFQFLFVGSRSGFKTMVREGEAPAEPGFPPFLDRQEPLPPGFEMRF
jgi:hypothetical protein